MKRGFGNSLSAIIDANVTTLLAAGALYQYTTGPVRGFAITLAIGIVAAVFVNLVVVPYVLDLFTARNPRSYMWNGFDIRGLQFVKRGPVMLPIAALVALASLAWVTVVGLPLSTDFTGGTNLTLSVDEATTTAEVREGLANLEVEGLDPQNATILEATDQAGDHQIIVRTALTDTELGGTGDIGPRLANEIGGQLLQADFVGPAIGADLRRGAINAVLVALGLILVYVGWRFWPTWGVAVAAIVASAHDVMLSVGALALFNIEFSIPVLAALLFVVGYSLNDTIIVADRVRENARTMRDLSYREIVDLAVNQTLTRTIVTAATTLLPVAALLIWGGPVLRGFSVVLLIGITVGTYSSLFILTPIIVWFKNRAGTTARSSRGRRAHA